MTTSAYDGKTLKLRGAADIVAALPYLVGFQPTGSLVLVGLRGERRRVGLTLRVDLPEPEWAEECVRWVLPHLERNDAREVIVALYPTSGALAAESVDAVMQALSDRLQRRGIGLREALVVADGRWWSLVCGDPRCCPPEGTPLPDVPSVVDVAMTVEGRRVLPSRGALDASLEPVTGLLRDSMEEALRLAGAHLCDRVWAGAKDEVAEESLRLLRDAVRARADQARVGGLLAACELSARAAARLIVGLDDVGVRDEVITWFDGEWGQAAYSLMRELAPRAVPPFHVVPLTVLGWLAYLHGEGALASMAAERALAADPDYGMAVILDDALRRGIAPSAFRTAHEELRTAARASRRPMTAPLERSVPPHR